MSFAPSYDPASSCLDTLEHDPFGLFADMTSASQFTRPIHTTSMHLVLAEDFWRTST